MEAVMGNWKMTGNGLNQGRLPRGGGLEGEWDSDGQKKNKEITYLRATPSLEKCEQGIHNG